MQLLAGERSGAALGAHGGRNLATCGLFLYIPSLLQRRLAGNFATNPCEQALSQVSAEQGRGLLSYPNHFASIIIIMLCLLSCALKKCGASVVLVYCLS